MNLSDYSKISHMAPSLVRYVMGGSAVGGFLQAVISNDLKGAVNRADSGNLPLIPVVVCWLYNKAPSNCWGSVEAYDEWRNGSGLSGEQYENTEAELLASFIEEGAQS